MRVGDINQSTTSRFRRRTLSFKSLDRHSRGHFNSAPFFFLQTARSAVAGREHRQRHPVSRTLRCFNSAEPREFPSGRSKPCRRTASLNRTSLNETMNIVIITESLRTTQARNRCFPACRVLPYHYFVLCEFRRTRVCRYRRSRNAPYMV